MFSVACFTIVATDYRDNCVLLCQLELACESGFYLCSTFWENLIYSIALECRFKEIAFRTPLVFYPLLINMF